MAPRPILDNHLHLNPHGGRGVSAIDDFARAGGTHVMVVNRPSWTDGQIPTERSDFERGFRETISVVEEATTKLDGRAYAVLGVHPALVSRLIDEGFTANEAGEIMRVGIDLAYECVNSGTAIALKSGRPHYAVEDSTWTISNSVLRYALSCAAKLDCAIQLHTESGTDLTDIIEWADAAGLESHRVVKHFADGSEIGPVSSVISRRDPLDRAIETGQPFLMETDFLDDPDRPGAVLGPKVVPRRVEWMREKSVESVVTTAHIETPKLVYGIDTVATLGT